MVAKLETTRPLSRKREDDLKGLAEEGWVASHPTTAELLKYAETKMINQLPIN